MLTRKLRCRWAKFAAMDASQTASPFRDTVKSSPRYFSATTGSGRISPEMTVSVLSTVAANATLYHFPEFSVYSLLGFMPTYWSILVYNQSGAAFDLTAANFYAKHSLVSYA